MAIVLDHISAPTSDRVSTPDPKSGAPSLDDRGRIYWTIPRLAWSITHPIRARRFVRAIKTASEYQ